MSFKIEEIENDRLSWTKLALTLTVLRCVLLLRNCMQLLAWQRPVSFLIFLLIFFFALGRRLCPLINFFLRFPLRDATLAEIRRHSSPRDVGCRIHTKTQTQPDRMRRLLLPKSRPREWRRLLLVVRRASP